MFLPFYSRTINPNLSISILVCSFKEGFCLVISQISTLLGKSFQNVPVGGVRGLHRGITVGHLTGEYVLCIIAIQIVLLYSVFEKILLELILFYKAASIHIQNPEDLLDLLR